MIKGFDMTQERLSQCGKENISLGAVFQPNQYPTNSGSTLSVPREPHQQQQQYTYVYFLTTSSDSNTIRKPHTCNFETSSNSTATSHDNLYIYWWSCGCGKFSYLKVVLLAFAHTCNKKIGTITNTGKQQSILVEVTCSDEMPDWRSSVKEVAQPPCGLTN